MFSITARILSAVVLHEDAEMLHSDRGFLRYSAAALFRCKQVSSVPEKPMHYHDAHCSGQIHSISTSFEIIFGTIGRETSSDREHSRRVSLNCLMLCQCLRQEVLTILSGIPCSLFQRCLPKTTCLECLQKH